MCALESSLMSGDQKKNKLRNQEHLFPIIDSMIDNAVEELSEEGEQISCKAGCDHCCHLLVEVSWAEAYELAAWIEQRESEDDKAYFLNSVATMAAEAREVFSRKKSGRRFMKPLHSDDDMKDWMYDVWFYEKKRPCPFLKEGLCAAYEVRPSPCRLHLVTSDPELCRYDTASEDDTDVPESIEEIKEELGPIITAINGEGSWGHIAIMVEAVLKEEFGIDIEKKA